MRFDTRKIGFLAGLALSTMIASPVRAEFVLDDNGDPYRIIKFIADDPENANWGYIAECRFDNPAICSPIMNTPGPGSQKLYTTRQAILKNTNSLWWSWWKQLGKDGVIGIPATLIITIATVKIIKLEGPAVRAFNLAMRDAPEGTRTSAQVAAHLESWAESHATSHPEVVRDLEKTTAKIRGEATRIEGETQKVLDFFKKQLSRVNEKIAIAENSDLGGQVKELLTASGKTQTITGGAAAVSAGLVGYKSGIDDLLAMFSGFYGNGMDNPLNASPFAGLFLDEKLFDKERHTSAEKEFKALSAYTADDVSGAIKAILANLDPQHTSTPAAAKP